MQPKSCETYAYFVLQLLHVADNLRLRVVSVEHGVSQECGCPKHCYCMSTISGKKLYCIINHARWAAEHIGLPVEEPICEDRPHWVGW